MYRQLRHSVPVFPMKVLVLDIIHGGKTVAEKFLQRGDEVTAVDVQKKAGREVTGGLVRRGIRMADSIPDEDFDICVKSPRMPASAVSPARCAEVIDFSRAVNMLFDPYDRRFRIEVTGGYGKTSLCFVLAHILDASGKLVYLHSSHGMGPYHDGKHIITDYQTILPASLLELPRTEYDVVVCEVSNGGSGKADIAAVTNAGDGSCTFPGMGDVFSSGINFVREDEKDVWKDCGKDLRYVKRRVTPLGKAVPGESLSVRVDYRGESEIVLEPGYLALSYLDAFDMALSICDAMDIPQEDVLNAIGSFKGAPGRGEVVCEDDSFVVSECNSGVTCATLGLVLSDLKDMGVKDVVIELGDASDRSCGILDPEEVAAMARGYGASVVQGKAPADAAAVARAVREPYR